MNVLNQSSADSYVAYHGDCAEVIRGLPDNSVHYSVYSPPFSSLYTYSASDRDLGNCRNDSAFFEHFSYLLPELLRVIKPGRCMSMHVMDLPSSKAREGFIGLKDFPGD